MNIENILFSAVSILAFIIGLFFRNFLPKYSGEKAKNLATKEDITEITDKIESVKHDYAQQLESVKADLSAKINTHGFRYEKEYEVLSELTALLVEVKDSALHLRPNKDIRDSTLTEEEVKHQRLARFFEASKMLFLYREKKRPFYTDDIYQAILEVQQIVHSESHTYQYDSYLEKSDYRVYWNEAKEKRGTIITLTNVAMEKIRERVNKWESLV